MRWIRSTHTPVRREARALAALALVASTALAACDETDPGKPIDAGAEAGDDAEVPEPCAKYRVYEYFGVTEAQVCPELFVCEDSEVEHECPDVYRCKLFQAHDVTFIHRDKLCDGFADCTLADDELDCPGLEQSVCARGDEGELRVYTPEQACDGHADCYFAEDEKDCPDSFICPVNGPGFDAIPRSKVCDGKWDCPNDEYDCPDVVDPFACKDGTRIDRKFVCNQVRDCPGDESDELDPSCQQASCGFGSLSPPHAAERAYIPQSKVCDGFVDCRSPLVFCDESNTCRPVNDESSCP